MPDRGTLDLFATPPAAPQPLTVSEVNRRAKALLERTFARVTVVGELANVKTVSGHRYFSLRDRDAQLPAVMFRREASRLKLALEAGMEVVATGRLTLYSPFGRYQLVVERLEPRGAGALQVAFEQLKQRLAGEGLFDAARKRPLPRVPHRVAVVTSPTGAVIRDIVNVGTRRFPKARLVVVPTRVQGGDAAPGIAAAVERAGRLVKRLGFDVVIVARGGGSLEDLWGFNDERVARAIAASPIPVVSAVGHETDFTISDFVADYRAPTPSAAAELVFPVRSELVDALQRPVQRGARALRRRFEAQRHRLRAARAELGDGRALVRDAAQRLAYAQQSVQRAGRQAVTGRRTQIHQLEMQLARLHPQVGLRQLRSRIEQAHGRTRLLIRQLMQERRQRLAALGQHLDALSPLGVLQRGYAIVRTSDGTAVRNAAQVAPGERLAIRVATGRIAARVTDTETESEPEA